ncbi:FAD-dependent monooxygenase [Actinophytocola sp. NPDC049390]|uniref:FAD-dependent monooxygenase n=1 Tax=Actinophytocola sp. NPDC049390 TaxID=3363894 RepID=UPI0037AA2AFD
MHHDVDVAIVGGGLGGLTLAISLLRRSVPVAVFEQTTELREIGAGVAIAANGARLLRDLGVELEHAGNIPPRLEFRRWHDGALIRSHEIGSWYRDRMGAPYVTMHRGTLQRMLADEVPKEHLHLGHQVTGLVEEPDGVRLRFADRPDVVARVVVGVDGVHSVVRRHVAGDVSPVCSGEIGFRGVIPVDASPELPNPTSLHVWCGPRTHTVYYGVDDGQLINLLAVFVPETLPAWTRSTNRVPATSAEALAIFSAAGWADSVLELIRNIEGDMRFWALQELPRLRRWSSDRVALAGDAAHAPLPHQGQGAGQAIEDAYTLGHLLAEAGPGGHRHAFETYERSRRHRTRRVQHYSRMAGKLMKLTGEAVPRRDEDLANVPHRIRWIHEYRADAPPSSGAVWH